VITVDVAQSVEEVIIFKSFIDKNIGTVIYLNMTGPQRTKCGFVKFRIFFNIGIQIYSLFSAY